MPVTPSSYPMANGRAVERLDMAQTGQLALPGLKTLFVESLEVMLPAKQYPFCTAGAVTDPKYYLELLSTWSNDGNVCRYIVSGTGINAAVLLGPIEHGEKDGTNDVYATIPLYEYRYLDEVLVEQTQNTSRAVENANQKTTADSYTVKKGDTLSDICRRLYGDSSLAYKLATANNIKNPDLIFPDQVLTLPDISTLSGMTPTKPSGISTKKSKDTPAVDDSAKTGKLTPESVKDTILGLRAELGLNPIPAAQSYMDDLVRSLGFEVKKR